VDHVRCIVLFFGRVALWSSLDSTPQSEAMVSLAFFLAAVVAGGCSQMIGRRGPSTSCRRTTRWSEVDGGPLHDLQLLHGALVIALAYTFYVVPYYGLHLGELFVEFAVAIFVFLLSAAPLYMLRRFYTLALATGLALVVTLAGAHLFSHQRRPASATPSCWVSPSDRGRWWSSPPAT
jgi:hypothetical protein